MRRTDPLGWIGLALALGLFACADDPAPPAETGAAVERTRGTVPVEPITDFDRYMLGDLPGPGALARDPFDDARRPAVDTPRATSFPAPALRGIVRADGRLVALFDRGSAGQGETVAGWSVRSIDQRSVTLQRNGRTVRRSL